MSGHGHEHQTEQVSDRGLIWAIGLNLLLTAVEIVAGILSGSLALISDAVHNGSDAGSLVVALIARRWSRRQPDEQRTYGYRRAAMVGALINVTTLVVIGIYLIYESVLRFLDPLQIDGWTMVWVAGVALLVDVGTVLLMRAMGPGLNIRAALAHNLADALASVGVIIAGTAVLLWDAAWVDPVLTLVIAGYILLQGLSMMSRTIAVLMDSVPEGMSLDAIAGAMLERPGVHDVHHLHLRRLDEDYLLLEAHVVVDHGPAAALHDLLNGIKIMLHDRFGIHHTTLEFEFPGFERGHSGRLIARGH